MREAFNLLRLMWGRERDQYQRFIMDGFMLKLYYLDNPAYWLLLPLWEHAADMAIYSAYWACEHRLQLPQQTESLHVYTPVEMDGSYWCEYCQVFVSKEHRH